MGATSQRIDKWLWHARIFKTRSKAAQFSSTGKIRIGGCRITKPSHSVAPGNILTFSLRHQIIILEIKALAARRGSYPQAQLLYEDLSPPAPAQQPKAARTSTREPGAGRPTKRDRRALDALFGRDLL
ncbi:MAG: RNA-binding S4 domain-containing protein [Alphaproteobacteria bacterium]